ncbi:MAG: GNAT family N-acetyltransferase [Chthoniobacter sp.]|nr:GNAT family N-acetyltransferase [Chthoniobacter sp.]
MLIREATESDATGIADVLRDITELRAVVSGTVEQTRAQVARALASVVPSPSSTVLVAVTEEEAIAGYCSVHWVPFLFFDGPEAYISELFVRQCDRSAGVGTALLGEVRRRAELKGCSRLSLLNGRNSEAYQRGFYVGRQWQERERMANFILPLR